MQVVRRKGESGFTLTEILVSILILSLSVLGIAGLQTSTMRGNADTSFHMHATFLAYDMLDKIRVNRFTATSGDYNIDFGDAPGATNSVRGVDLGNWVNRIGAKLPSGEGQVQCDADGLCNITIRWTNELTETGLSFVTVSSRV